MSARVAGSARDFSRPYGTDLHLAAHPALKRWAIIGGPSGTLDRKEQPRYERFPKKLRSIRKSEPYRRRPMSRLGHLPIAQRFNAG